MLVFIDGIAFNSLFKKTISDLSWPTSSLKAALLHIRQRNGSSLAVSSCSSFWLTLAHPRWYHILQRPPQKIASCLPSTISSRHTAQWLRASRPRLDFTGDSLGSWLPDSCSYPVATSALRELLSETIDPRTIVRTLGPRDEDNETSMQTSPVCLLDVMVYFAHRSACPVHREVFHLGSKTKIGVRNLCTVREINLASSTLGKTKLYKL